MKVVYGSPNTIMTMGVAKLGEVDTPFFGFIDKAKILESDISSITSPLEVIDKIDKLDGTIILIENPDAAERIHTLLSHLFSSVVDGDWGNVKKTEVGLQ